MWLWLGVAAHRLTVARSCATVHATALQHYMCCGDSDAGWGCAYRCVQMLHSGLHNAGVKSVVAHSEGGFGSPGHGPGVPCIVEIQSRLARLGMLGEGQVGSHTCVAAGGACVVPGEGALRGCAGP